MLQCCRSVDERLSASIRVVVIMLALHTVKKDTPNYVFAAVQHTACMLQHSIVTSYSGGGVEKSLAPCIAAGSISSIGHLSMPDGSTHQACTTYCMHTQHLCSTQPLLRSTRLCGRQKGATALPQQYLPATDSEPLLACIAVRLKLVCWPRFLFDRQVGWEALDGWHSVGRGSCFALG